MFKPRKRMAALAAAVVMASGLTALVDDAPASASVEAPGWPMTVTPDDMYQPQGLMTGADGSVVMDGCNGTGFKVWNSAGEQTNGSDGMQDQTCATKYQSAIDQSGVFYAAYAPGSHQLQDLAAFKDGQKIWETALPQSCAKNIDLITSLVIGSDGNVYTVSGYLNASGCPAEWRLSKFDAIDGHVLWSNILNTHDLSDQTNTLATYQGGLVFQSYPTGQIQYFDLNGQADPPITVGGGNINPYDTFSVSANGETFLPIYADPQPTGCGYNSFVGSIGAFTRDGLTWRYDLPACTPVPYAVNATPSGGFAALIANSTDTSFTLLVVDSDHQKVWQKVWPNYTGGSGIGGIAQVRMLVDMNGDVMIAQKSKPDNQHYAVGFDLYSTQGVLISSFTSAQLVDSNTDFDINSDLDNDFAISNQRLYFSRFSPSCYRCNELHSIKFAGLSMDYPRGASLGAVPISVDSLKYASLGDSYSSGESVEPFFDDSNVEGGDQCHRSKAAYSQLLDVDSRANIDNTVFVACSGATTHEITSDNTHNGEDAQDNHLSTDDNLVTISIGGNDIGFKELATACVQTPAVDCTLLPEAQQTSDALTDELPGALDSAFNAIKGKVGNNTLVYVVGYPQLIPDPNIIMGNPYDCTYLSTNERFYLRAVVEQLDDTIRTAAWNHGFRYVDPESFFYGHEICQNGAYFNGVVPQPLVYSFHPNALGQRAYEEAIVTQMEQDGLAE